jgi:FO synthase subunit 1
VFTRGSTLQVPPNLTDSTSLLASLAAGARDLGLSPVDEVNPDYPHPQPGELAAAIAPGGWQLQPRLPVYPQYDSWLPPAWARLVRRWRHRLAQPPAPLQEFANLAGLSTCSAKMLRLSPGGIGP